MIKVALLFCIPFPIWILGSVILCLALKIDALPEYVPLCHFPILVVRENWINHHEIYGTLNDYNPFFICVIIFLLNNTLNRFYFGYINHTLLYPLYHVAHQKIFYQTPSASINYLDAPHEFCKIPILVFLWIFWQHGYTIS